MKVCILWIILWIFGALQDQKLMCDQTKLGNGVTVQQGPF